MGDVEKPTVEQLFEAAVGEDADEAAETLLKYVDEDLELVIEVLWALGQYSMGSEKRQEYMCKVVEKVKQACPADTIQARLMRPQLELLKVTDAKTFTDSLRKRSNTRNRKWDIYDLKEEEAEGYCKLWTYLLHDMPSQGPDRALAFIHSCIGTFSLYPPRCADLALSVWEHAVTQLIPGNANKTTEAGACAAEVLKRMGVDVVELVGFRYLQHHIEQSVIPTWAKNPNVKSLLKNIPSYNTSFYERTPASLHLVASALMQQQQLFYSDLVPYLQPTIDVLQKEAEDYIAKKLAAVDALSGIDKKGVDADYYGCKQPNCYKFNDHYGLIIGLLHVGSFDIANELLTGFSDLQPMTYLPLARALAATIAQYLQKEVMVKYVNNPSADSPQDDALAVTEVLEGVSDLLCHLGHHVHRNLHLFGILLDAMAFAQRGASGIVAGWGMQEDESDDDDAPDEEENQLEQRVEAVVLKIAKHCLLPGLAVMTGVERDDVKDESVEAAPPALNHALWAVLKKIHFRERFKMYAQVAALLECTNFELQWAAGKVTEATARVLRRLTHDNTGELAKKLGKLSHSSPLIMFNVIFRQIMNYGMDIIPAVVDALKSFSPMALDVMTFRMVSYLSDTSKERLKRDKVNLDDWLNNLGQFTASFYRKHVARYDIRPMLNYMLWHGQKGHTHELIVLSEMLKATHVDLSDDNSDMQAKVLECGCVARLDCGYLYDMGKAHPKQSAKLSRALRKELRRGALASNLVLALGRLEARCIYRYDPQLEFGPMGSNLRMVRFELDRLHTVVMQVVQFITLNATRTDPIQYRRDKVPRPPSSSSNVAPDSTGLLPIPFTDLYEKHRLLPSTAFAALRYRVPQRPLLAGDECFESVMGFASSEEHSLPLPAPFADCWKLYIAFWTMQLQDLSAATQAYEKLLEDLQKKEKDDERSPSSHGSERYSRDWYRKLASALEAEAKAQERTSKQALLKLKENASELLSPCATTAGAEQSMLLYGFLQSCLWPRCIMSTEDALYCGRFLSTVTPLGFPLVTFLPILADSIPKLLCTCTDGEGLRVACLVNDILSYLQRSLAEEKHSEPREKLWKAFAQFHTSLSLGLLRGLTEEVNSIEQKMVIEVLRATQANFPMFPELTERFEAALQPLADKEELKAMVISYKPILARRKTEPIPDYCKDKTDYIKKLLSGDKETEKPAKRPREEKEEPKKDVKKEAKETKEPPPKTETKREEKKEERPSSGKTEAKKRDSRDSGAKREDDRGRKDRRTSSPQQSSGGGRGSSSHRHR